MALISASSYNTMQTKVAAVLGGGSGNSGYGQSVASGQVTQSVKVNSVEWVNLRNDLLKARQHQTGLDETSKIPNPGVGTKILAATFSGASTMATDITNNRLIRPPDNQVSIDLIGAPTASGWNNILTHTVTITFASNDAARWYFNSGSSIQFSGSLVNYSGSGSMKGPTWAAMLSGMGTITFDKTSTSATGSGTGAAIGFDQLTGSDQQIFYKPAPAGTYAANDYWIYARAPSSSQLVFTIKFQDDTTFTNTTTFPTGPQSPFPGPYGVDETVDGTLTSVAQLRRSSGSNVSNPLPTLSSSGLVAS